MEKTVAASQDLGVLEDQSYVVHRSSLTEEKIKSVKVKHTY